ncbi:hypothetical protein M0R72_14400 [Candidatus Pacearchaeota archaeon]|jgi:hypothetical protein|nr:hypothetical protein [Candidatus Pacearchaeota archaeon]
MRTIEVVSHCYARDLPHYAQFLAYQLSGYIINPPEQCRVLPTICYTVGDPDTVKVLDWFQHSCGLDIHRVELPPNRLWRRAIGRNIAAAQSTAHRVWFCDVDMVIHGECLDQLAAMAWPAGATMIYPKQVMIHKDHATGDQAAQGPLTELKSIQVNDFTFKNYHRAIGGVQIVDGWFAREHGYIPSSRKYQNPATRPFPDFRDDIAYRGFCQSLGTITPVDLPGIYRLRHSTTTYQ